ncbi:MAG: hypothetical protein HOA83_03305 [Candidatus Marinimicrobia bacterium]|nr:hypothetical protein [Candidatus Neomarinimicrobiota bacterium]
MLNLPRLDDMDLQELNALHAELYVTLLSFHSMGIGAIKHKFLRDHLQETMTDMQELMRQADKTIDSMSGTNR